MRLIDADALVRVFEILAKYEDISRRTVILGMTHTIKTQPTVDAVEVDKVAEMLQIMYADDCACNYNGNDEWLPEKCQYAQTDCPMPKEWLGCWKEFVKHFFAKTDGGTE